MNRRSPSNLGWVFAAIFTVGCAHYSVGNPTPRGERIVVETIAVPADVDVDGGELANIMVAHLRERGIDASWGAGGDVLCALSMDQPTGFGVSVSPIANLECDLVGVRVSATGDAQGNVGQEYRISTRNVVLSSAAESAIARIVPKIDRALRESHGQD